MADEAQAESQAMQEALQRVDTIRQAAHENAAIAQRLSALIEGLVARVADGSAVIERLAKQSEQIEVVLTVIQSIAEQTADSTPFGHSAHADPDTCSTIIRTGSRSAATQGWHCYSEVPGVVNFFARLRIDSPLRWIR